MTHPLPIASKLPIKTLVAKPLPRNTHTYRHAHTHANTCAHTHDARLISAIKTSASKRTFMISIIPHQFVISVYGDNVILHAQCVYGPLRAPRLSLTGYAIFVMLQL